MKIIIEDLQEGEEEQVIIKCHQVTPELHRLISRLKSQDVLIAYDGNNIHRISPSKVYYIESVDNKTFLYCRDKVFESKQKLYELENYMSGSDFLRISKSVILNLRKINSLTPALNGRFEAKLENGEKVIISRQYISDLKKRLGI